MPGSIGTRRADALMTAAIGAPVAALSLFMAFVSTPVGRALPLGLGVLTAHAALAARRTAPLASFGVVCAGFVVQAAASGLFLIMPSVLVYPVAVYSLCVHSGRRASALGLGTAALGTVLAGLRFVYDNSVTAAGLRPNPVLVCGLLLAVVVAAWSLGLFRRTQLAYLALLEERARHAAAERDEQARRAVLEERNRIAREMHDVVAHSLSVILSQAKGGQFLVRSDPDRAAGVLAAIENAGRLALTDMRGLLGVLRSAEPDGRCRDPQPGLRELTQLLDQVRAAGLSVSYHEQGPARPLSPGTELAAFRAVQEALTNTIKHAGPDVRAEVQLTWSQDNLTVTVRSRGGRPGVPGRPGHGLIGMRERIGAVGGSVSAGPSPGGFVVTARLPYQVTPNEEAA